jgi:hypothetical protein
MGRRVRGTPRAALPVPAPPCAVTTAAPEPKATPMSGSRVPGLVLPTVFLFALMVGAYWYWRHRGDD